MENFHLLRAVHFHHGWLTTIDYLSILQLEFKRNQLNAWQKYDMFLHV